MAGVMNLEFTGPRNYVQKPSYMVGRWGTVMFFHWTKRAWMKAFNYCRLKFPQQKSFLNRLISIGCLVMVGETAES